MRNEEERPPNFQLPTSNFTMTNDQLNAAPCIFRHSGFVHRAFPDAWSSCGRIGEGGSFVANSGPHLATMNVYEFANGTRAVKVTLPFTLRALREEFPEATSDLLVAEHGHLVIAINHLTARLAISRAGVCVLGDATQDLTREQLQKLQEAGSFRG